MTVRRRNIFVLAIVLGLALASLIIVAGVPGTSVKPKKTRLGLDLKGGVELTYLAKPTAQAKVTSESLDRSIGIMEKRVNQLGVAEPEIQRAGGNQIDVALPDVSNAQRAQEQVGKTAQLFFYDWEPNVIGPSGKPAGADEPAATGGASAAAAATGIPKYQAVLRALKRPPILRKTDTTLAEGCTPAQLHGCIYGQWYLLDKTHQKVLRGPEDTKENLYADGYKPPPGVKVEAVRVNPGTVIAQASPETDKEGKVTNAEPDSFYVLNDDPVLEGKDITNPVQSFESGAGAAGSPDVTFGFTSHGAPIFQRVTREIARRGQNAALPGAGSSLQHFAVVLDNQIITAPSIDYTRYPEGIDPTNGSEITGGFTITSAQNLADELQSGALPIKLELISQSQVSATLGKQALEQGLTAMLVGFLIVCFFLLIFYRVLGGIAVGGLLIYSLYYFALIKLIPITMTLPGIAGLILTIGIAADANIVIFERVKEEIRGGRSVAAGIVTGYRRGFAAIVDANVVTFMTAFILFALATSEVKGFAFTLGIGTLLSLFTAVLATQAALGTMGRSRAVSHPAMLGASKKARRWTFDFMGASKWFFSLSGTILLIGALAIGAKGINLGIDFKSGTRIQTAFVKPVTEDQIRSALHNAGFGTVEVQKISNKAVGANAFQISTKDLKQTEVVKAEDVLESAYGLKPGSTSDTSIGPTFGKTVANSAIIAIIASLLVISVYIALRFEWKYAVPVLIALMHDLLITSGVYALTGREVTTSTVAALLTILGYSLYDTIIVFDRVRENVPRMPRAAFSQIVNRSMSEVLTRSLATSFCTLLPVLALLLFGGETLKDFAFALMVGVASGAYSSIFIASPVLTHWKEREGVYRNRRARITRELGYVPAYATSLTGEGAGAEDEEDPFATKKRGKMAPRRERREASLLTPEVPGDQISKDEFDELVADLDIEGVGVERGLGAHPPGVADGDPAADLQPEDVVMPSQRRGNGTPNGGGGDGAGSPGGPRKPRKPRNRRHGRAR
jgi:SecD/SecF fusion protein